jgi:hypothetical protein
LLAESASGLAGNLRSFNWTIPADASPGKGRVRVVVRDAVFFIYKGVGKALPISARDMDAKERKNYGKR